MVKRFLQETQNGLVPSTIWFKEDVGHTSEAKQEAKSFVPDQPFQTPKPERLISRILHIASDPGDLVLDCFAGSGTTGAVAHKMGRRWIMIELNPHCHTHITPRLQKVLSGVDQGGISKTMNWTGGGGYRYYELAPSLLEKGTSGRWIINKKYNPIMLAEAMCKQDGFTFMPVRDPWWMHGYSTESDFIYVTPSTLSRGQLARLSEEVGENRSLLVYCDAFRADSNEFPNLTVKKIPKTFLSRCEWGKDDYRLKAALESEARAANEPDDNPPSSYKTSVRLRAAAKGVKK